MSRQATPKDGELSFGIEFEFVFYYKAPWADDDHHDSDAVVLDEDEESCLPPAVSFPKDINWTPYNTSEAPATSNPRVWAGELIEQAILSVPGARLQGQPIPRGTDPSYRAMYVASDDDLGNHCGWAVKNDISVSDQGMEIYGHDYVSFEVNTPALWDRPESHRHVYLVVQELVKRFRLRVNVSTGLHCHVGFGLEDRCKVLNRSDESDMAEDDEEVEKFDDGCSGQKNDLGILKRVAALLWAADGFLCHVHPPERALNRYSPPIRLFSRLAYGVQQHTFENKSGIVVHRELPLAGTFEEGPPPGVNPLPEQTLPSHVFPRLSRTFLPALRSNIVDAEAAARYRTLSATAGNQVNLSPERLRIQTVYGGVSHIMRCKNHTEVASLLAPTDEGSFNLRQNYNLTSYLADWPMQSRTVEFRESAGSLSPAWVAAWSGVCLGIFRFARDASPEHFWAVIDRLAQAESDARSPKGKGHRYDAVSLLIDMGLFAEATLLERRLMLLGGGEGGDPVRSWYPCRLVQPMPVGKRFDLLE
ncbi:hypothetical protein P885DRAFT_58210 [Corynascus similis CBS 632.67]